MTKGDNWLGRGCSAIFAQANIRGACTEAISAVLHNPDRLNWIDRAL
jgi:hypothetical protein